MTDITNVGAQPEEQLHQVPKAEKMTDWKKEPALADLKRDFTEAQTAHSAFLAKLREWEDAYNGKTFQAPANHKGSKIEPKLIRKQVEWRCPALSEPFLSANELFDVKPVSHEDRERAYQNGLILNNQFNTQINKVQFIDKLIRTVNKYGTAVVRLGWEFKQAQVLEEVEQFAYELAPPQLQQQLTEQYLALQQLQEREPDTYEAEVPEEVKAAFEMSLQTQQLLVARSVGMKQEQVLKTVINRPTLEVCDIRNVYVDPTCLDDPEKAQFIVYTYETTLADLNEKGRYKNLNKIRFDEGGAQSSPEHSYPETQGSFTFADHARRKLTVHEYWGFWDIHGDGLVKPIVATWVGNVMIALEENPFPDKKLPFVIINYIPEENRYYGIPDAELLVDNQKILGAVTRGAIDLLGKSANSQMGVSKNFLDPTNRKRFLNGENYEYNQNMDPRVHTFMHTYPEIPQSAMIMIQMMNAEAEAISGVKSFSTGGGITGAGLGEVATAVRGALDAASKREMSILRRISEGVIKIGRKIMSMNSEFLSEEEVVRISNSRFIRVRRDDLAGNFDVSLTIATAEENEAKAQELAMMLQTLGNNVDFGITKLVLAEIARLRKMPDLRHEILNFEPQPDPMQQQLQQLQMQLLEAQIREALARAIEAETKAGLNQAKVGVENARAESLQGDADNKALNFFEQQAGIQHNRELDKQLVKNAGALDIETLRAKAGLIQQKGQHNSNLMLKHAETLMQHQNPQPRPQDKN